MPNKIVIASCCAETLSLAAHLLNQGGIRPVVQQLLPPDPAESMRAQMLHALLIADGNITQAAEHLGWPRTTFASRMKQTGLSGEGIGLPGRSV